MEVRFVTKSDRRRGEIRRELLRNVDVADAVMHYAAHGQVDTADLWWLYDEHRIMPDGSAWLWAMMWEDPDDADLLDLISNLGWRWYAQGRTFPGQ
jgi:hypothetical protein